MPTGYASRPGAGLNPDGALFVSAHITFPFFWPGGRAQPRFASTSLPVRWSTRRGTAVNYLEAAAPRDHDEEDHEQGRAGAGVGCHQRATAAIVVVLVL